MNPTSHATSHKHVKLDQKKLDRARKILGVKTESETLELALDRVISEEEGERRLRASLRRMKGMGGIVDVFGKK